MRPCERSSDSSILRDTTNRLSSLSIVIDDFDSAKSSSRHQETPSHTGPRPYTRQSSDASIKKILEEKEHRKHEFWKLLDEHSAVVENLKKIEKLEHTPIPNKLTIAST